MRDNQAEDSSTVQEDNIILDELENNTNSQGIYNTILLFIKQNNRFFYSVKIKSERKFYSWYKNRKNFYNYLPDEEKLKIQEIESLIVEIKENKKKYRMIKT